MHPACPRDAPGPATADGWTWRADAFMIGRFVSGPRAEPDPDLPARRLELRVDGAPLAWYAADEVVEALEHLAAVAARREGRVVTVVHVEPGRPDAVLRTQRDDSG